MSRKLPPSPSLEHLRKQAKRLLKECLAGDPEAIVLLGRRRPGAPPPKLADAQHAIAREYGLATWSQLKQTVLALTSADPLEALEAAVQLDDADAVRDVLSRFPSATARLNDALPHDAFGATPLIAAVNQKNTAMVSVLLNAGADINQRSHWWAGGFGVIGDDAAMNRFMISQGARLDAHDASRLGMLDLLRDIVRDDPAAVNARFGDGQTPLHVASNVETADFLLDSGADIDARDVDHESTAAQYLIRSNHDVVRHLVSRGCTTDILMAAALGDAQLVASKLEEDPSSVWTTVSPGYFPMNDPRAGGTIYIWTLGNGKSAHDVAREFGRDEVLELLLRNSPLSLRLADACVRGDRDEVENLTRDHSDLAPNLNAELLARLPSAADAGNARAVELMLLAGWPVNAANDFGVTALHCAAFHGDAPLVRLLLRSGASAEARDLRFGGTPAGWAEHGAGQGGNRDNADYPAVEAELAAATGA
jgi:ankyrin repeat protein